jgi:cobalt-zinc-cadmium resistance protein CzcA
VRGLGLIKTLPDIERIVVKEAGGTPVFVRDVAEVRIGHAVRHGAAVLNGEREVVAGTVLMLRGGNAREVVQAVKQPGRHDSAGWPVAGRPQDHPVL